MSQSDLNVMLKAWPYKAARVCRSLCRFGLIHSGISQKMSSRKTAGRRGTTKKRAQRATSNVFAMFDQAQIQEFKEAFNMIDQNRDGFVDKEDLHDMLASLGMCHSVWLEWPYDYIWIVTLQAKIQLMSI